MKNVVKPEKTDKEDIRQAVLTQTAEPQVKNYRWAYSLGSAAFVIVFIAAIAIFALPNIGINTTKPSVNGSVDNSCESAISFSMRKDANSEYKIYSDLNSYLLPVEYAEDLTEQIEFYSDVIQNVESFSSFLESFKLKDENSWSSGLNGNLAEYYTDNVYIVKLITAGSSSQTFEFDSIMTNDTENILNVNTDSSIVGTSDLAQYLLFVELPRNIYEKISFNYYPKNGGREIYCLTDFMLKVTDITTTE